MCPLVVVRGSCCGTGSDDVIAAGSIGKGYCFCVW